MDEDLSSALAELGQKISQLERTLNAIADGEAPAGGASAAAVASAGATSTAASAPPSATGSTAAYATPASAAQPTPSWSRIVDEAIERSGAAQRQPAPAARAQPDTAPAADPAPGGAPAPTPPARQPRAAATARQAPDEVYPPSPAELLRFRDRLERAGRDLTQDYDDLLGRLSYAAVPTPAGPTISFARGAPSLDIVDVEGLSDAAVRAFESDPAGATAYGTSVGYPRLRSWIADRHGVAPERVLVTNGSLQADAFLFEQLVRAQDAVIVERPTYDRTLLSLRERASQVHAIELQPDGLDTDALARLLADGSAAQPTLAHIIPNFQNPAGYTMSYEKRRRLLELAADHGFMVFEDDPYIELRFSGETLPTMLSMDPERVVYASSFSKTVCPGIRVGYLIGPTELVSAIAQLATNTYISPNMVAQAIVYEFCASGAIDRSIETVKVALSERVETLANALRRDLPEADFIVPQGGYFMWVTLPEGTDVGALFQAAAERGVAFVKGTDFLLEGGENTLRLAYSGVTPEQIETGVARLAEAYRSL